MGQLFSILDQFGNESIGLEWYQSNKHSSVQRVVWITLLLKDDDLEQFTILSGGSMGNHARSAIDCRTRSSGLCQYNQRNDNGSRGIAFSRKCLRPCILRSQSCDLLDLLIRILAGDKGPESESRKRPVDSAEHHRLRAQQLLVHPWPIINGR